MRIGKRRISRKLLFILVPVVVLVVGGAAFGAAQFTDISGNTHEQAILDMANRGITTGYPDGTFKPDQTVTRGQMMEFLDRFQSNLGCTDCHDDTSLITGKQTEYETSVHGTGTDYLRATTAGCAGCHSGGAFEEMIAAGENPAQVTQGDPDPTRQDCRTCHQIHTTYTGSDWALETTAPVNLIAISGATYDGGEGNLCANCHQPRTAFPAAVNGMVTVDSTHWGPHHGPMSAMLLGVGGALGVTGTPGPHYKYVENTCVTCHMGSGLNHTFTPNVTTCQTCHADATSLDVDGVQTKVQGMLDQLKTALVGKGLLKADGTIVPGTYPEAQAGALWNWIYVGNEDKSMGVHNPTYAQALVQAGIDALK
jgi:hypothetical protein